MESKQPPILQRQFSFKISEEEERHLFLNDISAASCCSHKSEVDCDQFKGGLGTGQVIWKCVCSLIKIGCRLKLW
jgi:hypothetical protein